MAQIKNTKPEELEGFGRRLLLLCRENNLYSPTSLAMVLYKEYYEIVQPGTRNNKHGISVKSAENDVKALTRAVQKHFNIVEAYKVQSHFMYAYSLLFDCSLDYLYGRTDVKSCDLEVREICDKLHITETAVKNLIEGYDPDPEVDSPTRFWSEALSDEIFHEVPLQWLSYCMVALQCEDLAKKIEAIKKAESAASDPIYRTMMEGRRIALENLQMGKIGAREGAYIILSHTLSEYIEVKKSFWVESRHIDFEESYYKNEMEKNKLIEIALQEGAPPEKKKK